MNVAVVRIGCRRSSCPVLMPIHRLADGYYTQMGSRSTSRSRNDHDFLFWTYVSHQQLISQIAILQLVAPRSLALDPARFFAF